MISALDSSVILDILAANGMYAQVSEDVIRQAQREGKLVVCECVIAEIRPAFRNEEIFSEFLDDWMLEFIPSSFKSAETAGCMFSTYLGRSKAAKRVLPDFLIGAHALIHADRLIARDRGYLRDYFHELKVIDPAADH